MRARLCLRTGFVAGLVAAPFLLSPVMTAAQDAAGAGPPLATEPAPDAAQTAAPAVAETTPSTPELPPPVPPGPSSAQSPEPAAAPPPPPPAGPELQPAAPVAQPNAPMEPAGAASQVETAQPAVAVEKPLDPAPPPAIPNGDAQPATPVSVPPNAEIETAAPDLGQMREDIQNAVELVLENTRAVAELRKQIAELRTPPAPATEDSPGYAAAIQDHEATLAELAGRSERIEAEVRSLAEQLGGLAAPHSPEQLTPQTDGEPSLREVQRSLAALEGRVADLEALETPTDELPPPEEPVSRPDPLSETAPGEDWEVVQASGVPKLFTKIEAETDWRNRMVGPEQCDAVGKWLDARALRLSKDGFFVRAGASIAVCKPVAGGWHAYPGNIASTDRYHVIVAKAGS